MTGFGAAVCREQGVGVSVELKTVNNRYFKLALRMSDGYSALETAVEPLIRSKIERGTVNASIRIHREKRDSDYRLSLPALRSYYEQLVRLNAQLGLNGDQHAPRIDRLVGLPGVADVDSDRNDNENETVRTVLEKALREALDRLDEMRRTEGESMAKDLRSNLGQLQEMVGKVEELAPGVAPGYRLKLMERIGKVMSETGLTVAEADLVREVALFADRCDISEETVRFRSHLEQFGTALDGKESCGRKLDFLTQELFRETNTIGSKANDAEITRNVVEMKTVIERIREMVQNVE